MTAFKILGSGTYVPKRLILSSFIDETKGYPTGFTEKLTGVKARYYVEHETASMLAEQASLQALDEAGLTVDDVDCIISASGTMEQPIPCNASKLHQRLQPKRPIPAFDVNMTCLGFLPALDLCDSLLACGKYQTILVYASDIASVGIDWRQIKTAGIFGDGAAAFIITATPKHQAQKILSYRLETHSQGNDYCEVKGGGTQYHATKYEDIQALSMFQMQGKKLYKMAAQKLPEFVDKLLEQARLAIDDIDWLVPHQASEAALRHMQKLLGIEAKKFINIVATMGNQIAASIPTTLHHLRTSLPLQKGDKIMLLGTGAGLSFGGMILEY